MKFKNLDIEGVILVENFSSVDDRGIFVKTYSEDFFAGVEKELIFKESYYSISKKDVIRGMHFQKPPYDHHKLIHVLNGEILDVIVDLREHSPTFGQYLSLKLSALENGLLIPKGCAHGFKALVDNTAVVYNVTSCYNKESDSGIRWDSFGLDWDCVNPIISLRDRSFPKLSEFETCFE